MLARACLRATSISRDADDEASAAPPQRWTAARSLRRSSGNSREWRELSETRASRAATDRPTDRGSQSAPRVALITREPKLARKGTLPAPAPGKKRGPGRKQAGRGRNSPSFSTDSARRCGTVARGYPERQRKQGNTLRETGWRHSGGDYCGSARANRDSRSNCAASATTRSSRPYTMRRRLPERKAVDTVVPVKDKYGTQRLTHSMRSLRATNRPPRL